VSGVTAITVTGLMLTQIEVLYQPSSSVVIDPLIWPCEVVAYSALSQLPIYLGLIYYCIDSKIS
jgi:hypothetical protein